MIQFDGDLPEKKKINSAPSGAVDLLSYALMSLVSLTLFLCVPAEWGIGAWVGGIVILLVIIIIATTVAVLCCRRNQNQPHQSSAPI